MTRANAGKSRKGNLTQETVLRLAPGQTIGSRDVYVLRGMAGSPDVEVPTDWDMNTALRALAAEREHLRMHEAMLTGAVLASRLAGASWAAVGQVLGMTKQSAWERFAWAIEEAGPGFDS